MFALLQPALYCVEYPVSTYLLKLKSEVIGSEFEKSLGSNETEVTIGPSDGLKENRKYQYTVTARNGVGNTTSNGSGLGIISVNIHVFSSQFMSFLSLTVTSDVQFVTATVVGESTIDIQCLFIHGSDAVGCKVVLVSDHPGVNNETKTLLRTNTSAFGQVKVMLHQVGCYQRVLAYSIDVNNITNNIFIEGKLNSVTNSIIVCSGKIRTKNCTIDINSNIAVISLTKCNLILALPLILSSHVLAFIVM